MLSQKITKLPLARTKALLIERAGEELVVYDLEAKEAHCLKALAASVFNRCDGKTPADQMAAEVESELGIPVSEVQVLDAVNQLEACGLLETPLLIRDGISRRDAVKRFAFAGATAAFAGPLITSIAAPSTAMAISGVPVGCSGCGANKDCTSNHCCQNNAGKSCAQSCCVGSNNSCHFVCGTTTCACTVCLSQTGCGACPCSSCPAGSTPCCTTSC